MDATRVEVGSPRARTVGPILVAAAGALWGTIGVAAKGAFRYDISPSDIALWRAGGAFLVLLVAALFARRDAFRIAVRDLPLFAGYGLIGVAVFMTVYLTAIHLSTVATAAMLLYTAPAWVTVLARLLFREPLGRRKVAAVLLTVAGSALVVRAYDAAALRLNLAGVLAGLAAGLTYALYSIFGKHTLRRYDPFATVLFALGFGAGFLLLALRRWPALPSAAALPVVLFLVLVPTVLAYLLYTGGLRMMEAGRASIVATVEPVVAALLGLTLLGERLDGLQWVGGGLVLAAVALIQVER
jgi:drug/metabolite transporter (DMT)-like permease